MGGREGYIYALYAPFVSASTKSNQGSASNQPASSNPDASYLHPHDSRINITKQFRGGEEDLRELGGLGIDLLGLVRRVARCRGIHEEGDAAFVLQLQNKMQNKR